MGAVAGAAIGGLSGALANQKEGGTHADDVYSKYTSDIGAGNSIRNGMNDTGAINQGVASQGVRNEQGGVYGGLFGQGGQLDQAENQATNLMNNGYNLTPEDRTAYGQASGDVARQFGQQEQSLGQSLASRGLSNSNIAQAKFSGLQGNKDEQLAGLQTTIANNRMQMNQKMLDSARGYAATLGAQAQGAVGQGLNANAERSNMQFQQGMGVLGAQQNQNNANLSQQQQTQHASGLSNVLNGATSGGLMGGQLSSGMSSSAPPKSGLPGGMS